MSEKTEVSRRWFLSRGAASVGYALLQPGLLGLLARGVSEIHTAARSFERSQRVQPVLDDRAPDSQISYGTYPDKNLFENALVSAELLQSNPNIVGFFAKTSRPFSYSPELLDQINLTHQAGMVPLVSWGQRFSSTNIDTLTEELSRIQGPFIWRPWFEMQGNWARGKDGWYGEFSDALFIQEWRKMREKFAQKVPNAFFAFSPNSTDIAGSFEPLFPGEGWVDIVSLDAYNKHSYSILNPRHYYFPDLSAAEIIGPDLATFQRIAPNVPFILTEVGAINNDSFTQEAIEYVSRMSTTTGWMLFEWFKASYGWDEADWSLTTKPDLTTRIKKVLQGNQYRSSLSNGLTGESAVQYSMNRLLGKA